MPSINALYKPYVDFYTSILCDLTFASLTDKEVRELVESELAKVESISLTREDLDSIADMSDEELRSMGCESLLTKEGKIIAQLPKDIDYFVKSDHLYDVGTIEVEDEESGKYRYKIRGVALNREVAF